MRYSGLLSLLFCLFVLQVSHGYRQLTHLQPTGILESASPQSFAAAGDRLYFSAFQGRTGLEPWFTDGTTTGTTMLAELTLGSSGSEPSGFVSAGGRLFFSARTDGSQGGSIYVSDGTAAGTTRIPGTENALFFPMAVLKDGAATRMVFFQSVGLAAIEVIDGVAGIPVRYALPGTDDRTFVKASNGTHAILANPEGRHWITDGSSVGTRFLVDLYVGEFGSSEVAWASGTDFVLGLNPFGLPITTFYRTNGVEVVTGDTVPITGIGSSWVVVLPNGFALFQAATEETGPEPFVSDGTLAGTSILVDLVPGEFGSFPSIVRSLVHGKGLFVSSGTQTLYATDGTEAGTVPILSGVDNIRELGMINGDLILANVNYSSHAIYRTDGTAAGTSLLFVGAPLGDFSGNGTFGSRVFFGCAETVATGVQLCSTDGTPAGTGLFKVLNNIDEGTPAGLTSIPSASGTSRIAFTYGRNLTLFLLTHHIAAGTATTESLGVELVARMVAGTGLLEGSIFYNSFGTPGGFSKLDLGTRTVTLLSAESQVTPFASANSHVFAIQGSRSGSRLWTTDGTTEGTFSLGSIGPAFPDAIWNDEFIFYNSTTGELSKSDGTRAGTVPIKPLFPPGTAGFPVAFIPSPSLNALFFVFAETELSLWRTDGTADGTSLASNIGPDSFVSAADVPGVGIFLLTSHFTEGSGLSTTLRLFDGNELTTIRTWEDTDFSVFSAAAQGRLVFTLRFDDGHSELWSSDGTASGTARIPLPEGTVLPRRGLTSSPDGRVFFIAADPEEGEELWETRGTAESTMIVPGPATPGPDSSAPTETLVADGFLYVVAISPENQRQIYATDVASTHPSASVTASTHPGTSRPIPSTPSRSPSTAPPSNEPSASPSPPETIIAHIFTNENGWLKGGQRFRWGDGSCQTISRKVPTEVPSESSSNEIREQGKSLRVKTNDWSGCGSFYYHRNHNRFLNLTGATELRFWIKSTSMAKVEFEVGRPHHASTHPEQDSDDLKDAVFIPSTNGEWVQGSLSIAHRTQEELERVYGPFLITIFGKGQAFISNIVVVGIA